MSSISFSEKSKLFFFSAFTAILTYGFTLTNYSLSIDSETPTYPDFSLGLGRWGTNLVRYHIFGGHLPYFTLLLGLLLLSLSAVQFAKFFRLNGYLSYLFCGLFLTFPQLAYQLVFTLQADVIPLGFFCSAVAINFFLKSTENVFSIKSISCFLGAAFLLMFVISIYQALIFIPVVCYLIYFLQNTYLENFSLKLEMKKLAGFGILILISAIFYFISAKLLCPPIEDGYLSSYVSGESGNRFYNFYTLLMDHLKGKIYYGEKLFILLPFLSILLTIKFIIEKRLFVFRFITLLSLLILPFFISFFITNGSNPPRLYVTSGIVFAFFIVHFAKYIKSQNIILLICSVICLTNVYFITQLFLSQNKIFNHDKEIARRIDFLINSKYPDFDPNVNYVYFYGCLDYNHHSYLRIPNSEIFGGSFFNWDNGSNDRIINFIKVNDIAHYKMIDNRDVFLSIKDSISPMPVWPKQKSVKLINNVIVVKLGNEKGAPIPVE